MARCLIALGSNLGDRAATIQEALSRLDALGLRVVTCSRDHVTSPIGGPSGQPGFLNAAAIVETDHPPEAVLRLILDLEIQLGRVRKQRWDARTIDLDLLMYEDQVLQSPPPPQTPALVLPHPRLPFRRFVLAPAAEIAGDWVHPQIRWTLGELLDHVDQAANYVAIGDTPAGDALRLCNAMEQKGHHQVLKLDLPSNARTFEGATTRAAKASTVLQQMALPPAHDGWLLSGYWACDALILAKAAGVLPEQLHELKELLNSGPIGAFSPKLLVMFQGPPLEERWINAAAEVINSNYAGPVLWVTASDLTGAADELDAALRGMTAEPSREY